MMRDEPPGSKQMKVLVYILRHLFAFKVKTKANCVNLGGAHIIDKRSEAPCTVMLHCVLLHSFHEMMVADASLDILEYCFRCSLCCAVRGSRRHHIRGVVCEESRPFRFCTAYRADCFIASIPTRPSVKTVGSASKRRACASPRPISDQ